MIAATIELIHKIEPEASLCRHHGAGHGQDFWVVHVWGRQIGPECDSPEGALHGALNQLQREANEHQRHP
jgi:hypothetical protein